MTMSIRATDIGFSIFMKQTNIQCTPKPTSTWAVTFFSALTKIADGLSAQRLATRAYTACTKNDQPCRLSIADLFFFLLLLLLLLDIKMNNSQDANARSHSGSITSELLWHTNSSTVRDIDWFDSILLLSSQYTHKFTMLFLYWEMFAFCCP